MKNIHRRSDGPNSEESLRETLLDLKRARRAEHDLRVQNEVLLDGLELLSSSEDDEEMFSQLLDLLRDLLDFEEAVVLSGEPGCNLEPVAYTSPKLSEIRWPRGELTRRVLEGDPVATFRASEIPEWERVLEEVELPVVSALHVGLRGDPSSSMIVFTHSELGFFSPKHVDLGRRFSMLARQALVQRDLREMKLRAFERSVRHELFKVSDDLFAVLEDGGEIRQANPSFHESLGYETDRLKASSLHELAYDDDREEVSRHLEALCGPNSSNTFEARFRTESGEIRWLQWNLSRGDDAFVYAVGRDVTEQRQRQEEIERLNEELERLARTDELTQLYNRRYLRAKLKEEFERARRYGNPFALLYLDLDNFSTLNNRYGHVAGDRALEAAAEVLEDETREPDLCARYGGDEFVVLSPETAVDEAAVLAERLVGAIGDAELPDEIEDDYELRMSAGIATYDSDFDEVGELLRRADQAMYRAKHSEDSPVVWSPELASLDI